MRIKGIAVGSGKPIVCVPVVGTTKGTIVKEVRDIVQKHAQMIEWRIDWFEGIEKSEEVGEVLQELAPMLDKTILLCTYRSKEQGGEGRLTSDKLMELERLVAGSGLADLVDVEFYSMEDSDSLIQELQQLGVYVITSHHDFTKTPDEETLKKILTDMKNSSADIVKLAVMPQCSSDVLRIMKVTADFHERYPERPIVTMSMGQLGIVSRLSGELTGSCITFGAHGQCSAPGQMELKKLQQILDAIHGENQ